MISLEGWSFTIKLYPLDWAQAKLLFVPLQAFFHSPAKISLEASHLP